MVSFSVEEHVTAMTHIDVKQLLSYNQLLQLCTARTAWSDLMIRSDSVNKLLLVFFGKCTTLVVMKC